MTRQVEHHIEFEPEWETAFNLQLKLQNVLSQVITWTASAINNSDVLLRAFRATVREGERLTLIKKNIEKIETKEYRMDKN